jgi:dienelactone hydrolase
MRRESRTCSANAHRTFLFSLGLFSLAAMAHAQGPRVLPEGQLPSDARLGALKDLDAYFPFTPNASPEEWQKRAERVRRQVLVATGLWPMPDRTAPNAVAHGKVDRDGFTVEKVYLESYPGFYVTGNLYRPAGKQGPFPIVLCPHGHWANGRFHDWGPDEVRNLIVQGAERFEAGGRHPLQARCMQLARMGCVVFHYDMVGYADSQQISFEVAHRFAQQRPEMNSPESWGFFSPQAELRLQSIMGLQTYNSIRALDWLLELPDVDPSRIGVTGASGGGTQTFILCAIDPRPTVSFPAVMVSTGMQGGCTCENCDYLRVDTGNIELAALFAPKALGMTAADDWTREIMTKGFPELQRHWAMLGSPDKVMARALVHFPHNYNYVSRAVMYSWFNKHLNLGHSDPIVEEDFQPLTIPEMSVWDDAHPKPPGGHDFERALLKQIADASDQQIAALRPTDETSLAEYRRVVGGALDIMIGRGVPAAGEIQFERLDRKEREGYAEITGLVRYAAKSEELPAVVLHPKTPGNDAVVWVHEQGKAGLFGSDGAPLPAVKQLLDAGITVCTADLVYQGEFLADGQSLTQARKVENPREFAGYTLGYNSPLFAQRVQDILSLVSFVRNYESKPEHVHLVGLDGAGPWAICAAGQAGDAVDRLAADFNNFRFADVRDIRDVNLLPGAVKYGDLPGLAALAVPGREAWLAGGDALAAFLPAPMQERAVIWSGDESAEETALADWLVQ